MPYKNEGISLLGKLHRFHVNLGDQWTSRIDHPQPSLFAGLSNLRRNSVGAINDSLAFGDLVDGIDKDGALALQLLDHKAVVYDLFADVNGWTKGFERNPDNIDRPHHSGAKSAGF